jgi:LuxR family maltose regulon positive regulatory protein
MTSVTSLLSTKLFIPPPHTKWVLRPRLLRRLDEGLGRSQRLILVSAPAGFGKTTLVSAWLGECGCPAAWLSLDEGDNDPARFFTYVVAALQLVVPGIGETARDLLQLPKPPSLTSALTVLINEVAALPAEAASASCPLVLVLDDCHAIESPGVHDLLVFLLDNLPSQMRVIIATRADPPLPLSRLRARGQSVELRADDLRFTPAEAAEFLNQVMGLGLSEEDVAALETRTEGWIAGLQMASLALQARISGYGQKDASGFVQAFTGSNRYILDYLVEEVLQREPDEIQAYLLQTSILDRLCAPLCDAVCSFGTAVSGDHESAEPAQFPDAQATLEYLERNNLFVVPLDGERRWYRYHHLFADLLRQRLQRTRADTVPRLHCRASAWYEAHDLGDKAVEHALAGEDFERAARLIERSAETVLKRGEFASFAEWLDAIPADVIESRPLLRAHYCWAVVLGGRALEKVTAYMDNVAESDALDACRGEMAACQATLALYRGDMPGCIEKAQQALALMPEASVFHGFAARSLGTAYILTGDIAAACRIMEKETRLARQAGDFIGTVANMHRWAAARAIQGRLNEARQLYEEAYDFVISSRGHLVPAAVKVPAGLADALREQNHLEKALHYAKQSVDLVTGWAEMYGIGSYLVLGRVKQALGDFDGARKALQVAERTAVAYRSIEMDDFFVHAYQARLGLAEDDTETAVRFIERYRLDQGEGEAMAAGSYLLYELGRIVLARLHLAQGQPDEALAVLEPLLESTEALGRFGSAIEILALQALAFQAQGKAEQALAALERALSLGGPQGYVRIFVDLGEPMAELLQEATGREIAPDYAGKLLAAFRAPAMAEAQALPTRVQELADPLTGRELEVLQLLTTGLSTTEIAEELVISVNTVRSHVKNIYDKLDVHSRYQAVECAQELGLL